MGREKPCWSMVYGLGPFPLHDTQMHISLSVFTLLQPAISFRRTKAINNPYTRSSIYHLTDNRSTTNLPPHQLHRCQPNTQILAAHRSIRGTTRLGSRMEESQAAWPLRSWGACSTRSQDCCARYGHSRARHRARSSVSRGCRRHQARRDHVCG